jgi:hypothetical protein
LDFTISWRNLWTPFSDASSVPSVPSVPSTDQGLKPKEKFDVGEASPTLMEVLELKLLGKCHFHLHPWDGTMEILGKCPWFLDSNFPSETYHHFLGGLLTASAVLSL